MELVTGSRYHTTGIFRPLLSITPTRSAAELGRRHGVLLSIYTQSNNTSFIHLRFVRGGEKPIPPRSRRACALRAILPPTSCVHQSNVPRPAAAQARAPSHVLRAASLADTIAAGRSPAPLARVRTRLRCPSRPSHWAGGPARSALCRPRETRSRGVSPDRSRRTSRRPEGPGPARTRPGGAEGLPAGRRSGAAGNDQAPCPQGTLLRRPGRRKRRITGRRRRVRAGSAPASGGYVY